MKETTFPEVKVPERALPGDARKEELYAQALEELRAVLEEEGSSELDPIAMMATISSILANTLPHFFWTGFYRVSGSTLVIGPYIGTVGCLFISFGRGVCGTAAAEGRSIIVADVEAFPGHISCDARSRSEIVVPVRDEKGTLIAVLDVDSTELDAFNEIDQAWLERICALFGKA